jgi:hypothetical protein
MLIFLIGFPNRFTNLCEGITLNLARLAYGSAELISADTPDEFTLKIIGTETPNVIVGARRPSPRLRQMLIQHGSRFIVALSEPWSVVAEMIRVHHADPITAVRTVASSTASVLGCAKSEGALTLTDRNGSAPIDISMAVDHHFSFQLGRAELLAGVPEAQQRDSDQDIDNWWQQTDARLKALVNGALDAFVDYAASGQIGQITWERSLFYVGDNPGEPATRALDIAGTSRCLIYGPYITLPLGGWTAHVVLACSRRAVGMSLVVEVTSASLVLGRTRLPLEQPGIADATLDFMVSETMETPIEVRVFNERAAIDGQIGLGRVILIPRITLNRDNQDNVVAELGLELG